MLHDADGKWNTLEGYNVGKTSCKKQKRSRYQ